MQPVNATLVGMLQTSLRAPRAYISAQVPVITNASLNTIDPTKLGSQLILDHLLSVRRVSNLSIGADTLDFSLDNSSGQYTPIQATQYSRYLLPGVLDNKYQLYLGLTQNGQEVVLPKGVFIAQTVTPAVEDAISTTTVNSFDALSSFIGDAYIGFPPRLYGNQAIAYYQPSYNLVPLNAGGGTATRWGCDAINWMTAATQSPAFAADYVPVAVYVGTTSTPASSPVSSSTYTVDYPNGIITFTTAQSTSSVISVDARPLAMAPEKMLYHLFVDYGSWSPAFLKFDQTGCLLPAVDLALERAILDVATDIVTMIAPRGTQWRLWADENGFIRLSEGNIDGPPVAVLVDTKDILRISPQYTTQNMYNVIRAVSQTVNSQPITVVSYDVTSISTYGQTSTYDVPTQYVSAVPGLDPGTGVSYLNGITGSLLFQYSTPSINIDIDILWNPALQCGDPVTIIESKTGINKNFYIQQNTENIDGDAATQTLTLTQLKDSQDFQYGLALNVGAPTPNNTNTIQAQTGIISSVVIGGTAVVTNGNQAVDLANNPVLVTWNGHSALPISMTINPPQGGVAYMWRWVYVAEDAYQNGSVVTGSASGTGAVLSYPGYDAQNNIDSAFSRRQYWPLLFATTWANDGITSYSTTTTTNDSLPGGLGTTNSQFYGNLRVGVNNSFGQMSSTFQGAALYGAGTLSASALGATSSMTYGVDFGPKSTNSTAIYSGIKRKITPAYLGILVATTAGSFQFKRIKFLIGA